MPKISIAIPSGGLVIDKPAEYIDHLSIANVQNVEIKRNIVQKRQGATALGASLGERIMAQSELQIGQLTYFVRVGLTKAQVLNKTAMTWADIAHTALTASGEEQISFAFPLLSAAKHMVYTNGVDNIRKYSGTGNDADLGGTPPKAKFLLDFKDFLLLAYVTDGGTDYYTRVQWSDVGDPESWTPGAGSSAGSLELLEDSLEITGISRFGDYITVHKESAIYLGQLTNTSEVFHFTRKDAGMGTISHGSIQNLPDGTQMFLARDGFRIFNGVTSTLIPSSINEELRDSVNPTFAKLCTSVLVADLDEYWCGVPIGSDEEPATVYKYNYRTGQMYRDYRTDLTSLALYRRTADETWDEDSATWDSDTSSWDAVTDLALHLAVAFGDSAGSSSLRSSDTSDGGTAIDMIWDSKDFNIIDIDPSRDIGNLIRWKGMELWAKGTSIQLYYSIDSGSSWTAVDSLSLESDYPSDDTENVFYFDVLSSKIRFRFRNNTTDQSFSMKQFVIRYTVREARK